MLEPVFSTVLPVLFKGFNVLIFRSEKNPNKLPPYIFLIWQDNIVWIICLFLEMKTLWRSLRLEGHVMASLGRRDHTEVKRSGCTYLFDFGFLDFSLLPFYMQ